MVDLVGDETGGAVGEGGDAARSVNFFVFDVNGQRSWDTAAHVEEAQTAFVLVVGRVTGFDDAWVEQGEKQ